MIAAVSEEKMAQQTPIRQSDQLDLSRLVNPAVIGFASVTMNSENFICVTDQVGEDKFLVIIDLKNPRSTPQRHKIGAASAVMHPTTQIIALKGQGMIQIYNLEVKARIKTTNLTENVEYMRWISLDTLALITTNSVYHWPLDGDAAPVKVFDRSASLASNQIINYRCNEAKNWLMLQGVTMEGTAMKGNLMLYCVDKRKAQVLPGHTGLFIKHQLEGKTEPSTLFCFAHANKLNLIEVSTEEGPFMKNADIFYPPEFAQDFPVAMEYLEKYGLICILSGYGFLFVYEVETLSLVSMSRISQTPVFATTSAGNDGLLAINKTGSVIRMQVDAGAIIPFITSKLRNLELAIKVASRANVPGAEDLFREHFEALFRQGQYKEAAKVAASSPQGVLRTEQTIARFKQAPVMPGQAPPLIQYFSLLLDKGKLNQLESLELVMPIMLTGRKDFVDKWLKEGKLTCSEELGNFMKQHDLQLALAIYLTAECSAKVVQIFAETGDFDKIIQYSKTVNYQPDYVGILRALCTTNPKGASDFAIKLATFPAGPLVDPGEVMELFYQRNMIPELTAIMIDVLARNDPADSKLQTRFLEILLQKAANVADAIFGKALYSQYDRTYIAQCCEKAHLYQRALEHYTEQPDILRCIVNTNMINPDFLVNYFGQPLLTKERGLEALKVLLKNRQNMTLAIEVAKKFTPKYGAREMSELFESFKMFDGLYIYLGTIVPVLTMDEKDLVLKFIVAAAKMQQFKEIERVVRDLNNYDPREVKDFLKEAKIDPQSLIIVCDRHDFVDELTKYLYENNMHKAIEGYVTAYNPRKTPVVVGTLLDLGCNEDFVKGLLNTVRAQCPIPELVEEVEKRNRLKMLQQWLETRVTEDNNVEPATHSALAKIYIDSNSNADQFLENNLYYDTIVVGKYCEKRDPHRAVIAYRRGKNDDELIEVTNRNSLFKAQARYLVERQAPELWAKVLVESNPLRRQLIDQVVSTALPQSKNPEDVSATVKAFMNANLPNELIELLEKIMLRRSEFSSNKNLQNLLIVTAIRAAQDRVKDYIQRLDNYDGPELAKYAIKSHLYEEAFEMYKKFNKHIEAVGVLLREIGNIQRATDYAAQFNLSEVWSELAEGQLNAEMVPEAIESYIKAQDPSKFDRVIEASKRNNLFIPLIPFLMMARKQGIKDGVVDGALVWAYAKTDRLGDLDDFIASPHLADLQAIGDECFAEGLFMAARSIFTQIGNWVRLASTLLQLQQYQAAFEAAKKAMTMRTWKEVCFACVEARQFALAQKCGVNICVQIDELEELIRFYLERGHFDEIIALLEYAIDSEQRPPHMGMYTELGVLYSKFKPERLMDHLKKPNIIARLNIPQLLRVCEENLQWPECCFLYCHYDEYDYAATTMLNHGVDAWTHQQFKEVVSKIANVEIYYKSIDFYLQQHPLLLNDLLQVLSARIDHARVVSQCRRAGHLGLVKPYLIATQHLNIIEVNEALNELFIEEEDTQSLRRSLEEHDQYDAMALARRLEQHELLEMRRISAWIFKTNKRYAQSVALSKRDSLYADAMLTAAASGDVAVAEDLLRFFADLPEDFRAPCFAACLYACYDILPCDVVMELGWSCGLNDYAMPFLIQSTREYTSKVDRLLVQAEEAKKKPEAPAAPAEAPAEQLPPPVPFAQPPPPAYFMGGYGQPSPF